MEQQDILAILNQTNLRKQYALLNEIIPKVSGLYLLQLKKSLLFDLFNSCFDDDLIVGSTALQRLLSKLLQELTPEGSKESEYEQLVELIFKDYQESVGQNAKNYNLNYSQQIHKVINNAAQGSLVYLIKKIISIGKYEESKQQIWSVVSLMSICKSEGILEITDKFTFKGKAEINFDHNLVHKWMFNCKRSIQFEAFQVFALHSKTTATPSIIEYENILSFIKLGIKTSYPNFRKNFVQKLKFFFERLRMGHQKDFKLIEKGKKPLTDLTPLIKFIKNTLDAMYQQLLPECCFEISNPCLEILKMVYFFMGNDSKVEVKKGTLMSKTSFLLDFCYDDAYRQSRFESILTQMSSNWESSRVLSYEILELFPKNLQYIPEHKINQLLQLALQHIASPIIRWYEFGSFLYSWVIIKYVDILFPGQNSFQQSLNYLILKLRTKFQIFKEVFSVDIPKLQSNLIHGYICVFSVILKRMDIQKNLKFDTLQPFFINLLELIREIMEFGTQVSSDNICTWIIDEKNITQSPYQVDCRGHFYQSEFITNVQKVLQGNTLIQSLDDQNTDNMSENVLVVSFFLITRESGLFFQELAKFISADQPVIPNDSLKRITYQFFHALLNIKHLGSIDRIAQGLYDLCKTMCFSKKPQMPGLVEELIQKLIDAFDHNQLKNVFRRSAGLPHLVCCLLKSCDRANKSKQKVIQLLLDYAQNGVLEMRIHALNVLRKLFMEAALKPDLEQYIQQSYMVSIDGFSYDDWSVRNSSLMLFSALTARTLGRQNQNTEQITQKITLIEFFQNCPLLIQFFQDRIGDYTDNQLYPSLYPIALVLSRLAPMEGKFVRNVKTEYHNAIQLESKKIDVLLPALVDCLKNKNYLGRVIVSKSILPFLKFENIPQYATTLLQRIPNISIVKQNHNNAHGFLLLCLQLFKDYYNIKAATIDAYSTEQKEQLQQNELQFLQQIDPFLVKEVKCPPVKAVLYQLLNTIMKNSQTKLDTHLQAFLEIAMKDIQMYFYEHDTFRLETDIFHSVLRKKQLSFVIQYKSIYSKDIDFSYIHKLTADLIRKYIKEPIRMDTDDLEILQYLYKLLAQIVKLKKQETELALDLADLSQQLLQCPLNSYFSNCAEQLLQFLLNLSSSYNGVPKLTIPNSLIELYKENGQIVKQIIKLKGYILLSKPDTFDEFVQLCDLYSNSNNVDDLRVAVIKAIRIAFPQLKQKNSIKLTFIYLRLLQDENPDIRNLIAKLLCQILYGDNYTRRINYEYLIDHFFELIFEPLIKDIDEAARIMVSLLFDSEFFLIKRQNHICKRIFQYEKSNKYSSELTIRAITLKSIKNLILSGRIDKKVFLQALEQYENNNLNTPLMEFSIMNEIEQYKDEITQRDEYLYENLTKLVIHQELKKLLLPEFQPNEKYETLKVKEIECSFELLSL